MQWFSILFLWTTALHILHTNININILFDNKLTCMQINTYLKNGGEGSVMLFSGFIDE